MNETPRQRRLRSEGRLTHLDTAVVDVAKDLVSRGLCFPSCVEQVMPAGDYGLRAVGRLRHPGEEPNLSGMASRKSRTISWRSLQGYTQAAGSFLHVRPEWGEACIILPRTAEPVMDDEGRVMFRTQRTPTSGRICTVGTSLEASRGFGRLAAESMLHGTRDGWAIDIVCPRPRLLEINEWLGDRTHVRSADKIPGGVRLRMDIMLRKSSLGYAEGLLPKDHALLHSEFHKGVADILAPADGSEFNRVFVRDDTRRASLIAMAADAELDWKFYADGRLGFRRKCREKLRWVPCEVSKVSLPCRAGWPVPKGLSVHPSGLVYALDPTND